MATIRALRTRIRSIQGIHQITRAMEMVATTKLRRFHARAETVAPYSREIEGLMARLALQPDALEGQALFGPGSNGPPGLLLITSDRGLCGSYNTSVLNEFERGLESIAEGQPRIYLFGRKGAEWLKARGLSPAVRFEEPDLERSDFPAALALSEFLAREFASGAIGLLDVICTRLESMTRCVPVRVRLLPITAPLPKPGGEPPEDLILEPGRAVLLRALAPRYLAVRLYDAMTQALASEYASRRISMKNASDAASNMRSALVRTYNRARQDSITRELLDIMGGAEALA